MAGEACAGVEETWREFCIFDVVAAETGEVALQIRTSEEMQIGTSEEKSTSEQKMSG
jgi:hypothetical protein